MIQQANRRPTEAIAHGIRRRVFEHTIANNGGYLSQACSAAEVIACLYNELLHLGDSVAPAVPRPFPGTPKAGNTDYFTGAGYHGPFAPDYDRFFISPVHYALVIYAALIEVGRMAENGLDHFNQDGSSVEMIGAEHSPGMEITGGSLAQGLSTAAGVAWARKRRREAGKVWVYMSDGEFQEGQTWEAFANIRHYAIDNLRIVVDVNAQQCDGAMASVQDPGDTAGRLRAFGARVHEVDAHDLDAIRRAAADAAPGQALVVLARSSPFQGMDYLQKRFPRLHYVRFKSPEEKAELQAGIAAQLYAQSGQPQ